MTRLKDPPALQDYRVPRRPKVSKSRTFRGEAVRAGLAPKVRKPFVLYVMENRLVKPSATKSQYQAELKRLGQAWKRFAPCQRAQYNERSMAEFEAQRQAVMSAREKRSNDKGQVSNVPVFGEFWLGPDKVKKSGHNGFSAVAGQGSYGKVLIARGECGRLHAVKVLCGRDAIAEAEHEVVLYQSLQELKDCDRQRFRNCWLRIARGGHFHGCRCLLVA